MKSTRYLKYCFFFKSDTCDNSALVVATACYRLYCGFLFLFKLLRQLNKALQKLSMNFLNGFLSQPRVIVEPRRQHIHRNTDIHPPSALTSTKKSPLYIEKCIFFSLPIWIFSLTVFKAKSSLCHGHWLLYYNVQLYLCVSVRICMWCLCMSLIFSPSFWCQTVKQQWGLGNVLSSSTGLNVVVGLQYNTMILI